VGHFAGREGETIWVSDEGRSLVCGMLEAHVVRFAHVGVARCSCHFLIGWIPSILDEADMELKIPELHSILHILPTPGAPALFYRSFYHIVMRSRSAV